MNLLLSPITNDPLSLIAQAALDLYGIRPSVDYYVEYTVGLVDESGAKLDGLTTYSEIPRIELEKTLQMQTTSEDRDIPRAFVHELAHVVVGYTADHGKEWERVFDAIYDRYRQIEREIAK